MVDSSMTFAADHSETVASMLRGGDADADSDNTGHAKDYICQWLDNMAACGRRGFNLSNMKVLKLQHLPGGSQRFQWSYSVDHIIHCLRIAGCLRGDRLLDYVVEESGVLIGMSKGWLTESNVTLPSRQTLGRMWFVLDAGLSLGCEASGLGGWRPPITKTMTLLSSCSPTEITSSTTRIAEFFRWQRLVLV